MESPTTCYASSGDVRVAYQVTGGAGPDVVLAPGTVSHLELVWEFPPLRRMFEQLGEFCRLVRFDKRGTGLSDRITEAATLEERTDDIRAVMDAAGSERAFIVGVSEGASMACVFAATSPERTRGLIVWGGQARWVQAPDYPWGETPEEHAASIERISESWPPLEYITGGGAGLGEDADQALIDYYMRVGRFGASPSAAVALERLNGQIDIRDILPTIHVPTLVLNRTGDPVANIDAARDLAARIPGARLVELPGNTHSMFAIDPERVVGEIRAFVTGARAAVEPVRMLATILFVDVVGSTELAGEVGDAAWRNLLDRFYAVASDELRAVGGLEVDRAGDGLLATFDGPTRAIRCALAVQDKTRALGLRLRAGVHAGEVERADGAVRGIAVHTAARIAGLAGVDEVLVSATVRDLTAGSGLAYADRGLQTLKGIPEPRQLYAVAR
jgi:pimeloyl-ACP methyl ester carboxylesterase/class 3 adenylate cyclase